MGKNYVFDVIREEGEAVGLVKGREEGKEEGKKEAMRENILTILRKRFGNLPSGISSQIQTIDSLERLDDLLGEAVVCPDLETFHLLLSK